MRAHLAPAAILALTLAVSGCAASSDANAGAGGALRVVTTVSPITSLVSSVAGAYADVVGIVPEGENSHEFAPKPSVAKQLAKADLIFVNGLGLEEPTIELARANRGEGSEIVELGAKTITRTDWVFDFSFPESGGQPNPHLWTNPLHGRRYAEVIRDSLVRADPAHAAGYRANFAALAERIGALDAAVRAATSTVPADQRKLLTYHDSFPYFAREYGWTVIGAIQPSDFAEPSPKDVAGLIRQIRAEGVPAIFGSEVFPSPVLEQIGRETGVRYVDSLRDDDLPGEPGDGNHSYVGLLVADFVTMVRALGGDASALEAVPVEQTAPDRAEYAQ